MQRFGSFDLSRLRRLARWVPLCLLAGLLAPSAWAQTAPANDNFANALPLTNSVGAWTDFGTVTGDNTLATAEAGEPAHAGIKANASLWYKWTAHADGVVEFDTFNSAIDSVLAVYVPTVTNTPTLSTLNQVVANDDINPKNPENANRPNPPQDPFLANPYLGPSGVKFNARAGTTYYIAVDGYTKNKSSLRGKGAFTLAWSYLKDSPGVFRFSSVGYICAESESRDPIDGSNGPSARGARITVTRLFGAAGKVKVSFALSDGVPSVFGTNQTGMLGVDYEYPKSTNLVFDDYEISKSFVIPIDDDDKVPNDSNHFGRLGGLPQLTRVFTVSLSALALDPDETTNPDTSLAPPRFDTSKTNSVVQIIDLDTDPGAGIDYAITNGGTCVFERTHYRFSERVGMAHLRVYRIGGDLSKNIECHYIIDNTGSTCPGNNYFDLQAGADYAAPSNNAPASLNWDFGDAQDHLADDPTRTEITGGAFCGIGTIKWDQNDPYAKDIWIPIVDDNLPEFNEEFFVHLVTQTGHQPYQTDLVPGYNNYAHVTIAYDDYPAGALDDSHNPDFDVTTEPVYNSTPGADDMVYGLAVQTNDQTIVVGQFSSYNYSPRYGIARLNKDGSLDTSFDPGQGVPVLATNGSYFISSVALTPDGKAVIGGSFKSYNGTPRYNLARLNYDGSLDTSFNPGTGATNTIWAVAVQTNGQVLVAGEFTYMSGQRRSHIARLNLDGSVDTSFNPETNAVNGTINALALSPDGSVYIGGDFTAVGSASRHSVALLSTNGGLVAAFNPLVGPDGPVHALGLQANGKLLIGGAFHHVELRPRNNIARYNPDGNLDLSFDPGTGADDAVYSITLQPDQRIFLGGIFNSINGTRRMCVARLFSTGEVDTGFMDTAYNQFAGLHKPYWNPYTNPQDFLFATALQSDGNLMIGGSFHYVGGGRYTSLVQTNNQNNANGGNFDDVAYTRAGYRIRYNVARLIGGDTMGPGSMSLVGTNYTVPENSSYLYVKTVRQNGNLGQIESIFSVPPRPPGPGVALSGVDYSYTRVNPRYGTSWTGTRAQSDGIFGTNNVATDPLGGTHNNTIDLRVNVANLSGFQGDRSAPFQLDLPSSGDVFFLGGENIPLCSALAQTSSTFDILETDTSPGVIGFSSSDFYVNESQTYATVTIVRTNGAYGLVNVRCATTNASAVSGVDYYGQTNTVVFKTGQTSTNFSFQIVDDYKILPTGEKTVQVYLSSPGLGATLGAVSNATVHIIDDNFLPGRINFTPTSYSTNESAPAAIFAVSRTGGNLGVEEMAFATSNLTAVAGINYQPVSGILHWDSGDISVKYITVPLLRDNLVTPDLQFTVTLLSTTNTIPGSPGPRLVATNTIINQDFYGQLQFSASSYNVDEQGGYVTVTVNRVGGSAQTVSADYSTIDGTAYQFINYYPTSGRLTFGPGVISQSFNVRLLDDYQQDVLPFGFNVQLANFAPANAAGGSPTTSFINILDRYSFNQPPGNIDTAFNPNAGFNDSVYGIALQPDSLLNNGSQRIVAVGDFTAANGLPVNRIARLYADGTLDQGFLTTYGGADGSVRAVVNQSDTRLLVGGSFSNINNTPRSGVARLNYDGTVDTSFVPGSGAAGTVYALAETFLNGGRKILVGGDFGSFNGAVSQGFVRLNDDGTVDTSFLNGIGVNGTVFAVATYPTNSVDAGKVLIGGIFSSVNGVARNGLARLNVDGSVDASFNPGTGTTNTVAAIAIQNDGKVLIGGTFTSFNQVGYNRLARLNADGSLDTQFKVGPGANESVDVIALQPDNRILVGGSFTRASGVTRNRLTRLMPDGTVDPTINFDSGANNFIAAIAQQTDNKIVLGGGFTQLNGLPRAHVGRIYGGSVTGSGRFTFNAATYQADETSTNLVVTVLRTDGTSGPNPDGSGSVFVDFLTSDGTAKAGVNYTAVQRTLEFPAGETVQQVVIPLLDDQVITPDLTVNLRLANPMPAGVLGDQPTATLTILNDESAFSFSALNYSIDENDVSGVGTIEIERLGSVRTPATVTFVTTTNGTAVAGVNYTPVTNLTVSFLPGQSNQLVQVPVLPTPGVVEGDTTVGLLLTNPSGALLLTPFQATLTVRDVDQAPGNFTFSQTNYVVGEGAGSALITVLRTNGHSGRVSVAYATVPVDATPNLKYISTNNVLFFDDGVTSQSFRVPILEEGQIEGPQSFVIQLSQPSTGTSIIGTNPVPVTILDDDVGFSFGNVSYIVSETNTVVNLDVLRLNTTNGTHQVTYTTTNGTAKAGINYLGDSRTLSFGPGESRKTISISILRDPRVTGDLTFGVNLYNPTPGTQLATPSSANVVVLDVDSGLSFADTNSVPPAIGLVSVMENATNLVVTVLRTNANTGTVQVHYRTVDGTAVGGGFLGVGDYGITSGLLVFTNGQRSNTITVPIYNNATVDGDRTFSITLDSPTAPAQLLNPSTLQVTILDDDSGFRFSSSTYDIIEGGTANILVQRVGSTSNTVSVAFATQNGTASAGYTAISGTLTFTNGETLKSFPVDTVDDTTVQGDRTVLLGLSNPSGTTTLLDPSSATLTIHDNDGSVVVPAGVALQSESFTPANGVIDPNETVTLLFAFRNSAGNNTTNLLVTLLATNGVSAPSAANNYGVLVANGPSVSRPFTFTANGTNGQKISATFRLTDNGKMVGTNAGLAIVNFTLGTNSASFSSPGQIVINDYTNANPYPSPLTVSGLNGVVTHLSVSFTNLNHTSPSDIDALLVSPTGQASLLMANAGGNFGISKVNLTFDDAAANRLPSSNAPITNGTYQPTAYYPVASFPVPAPPPGQSLIYTNALAAFNGINPNGNWQLFIIDDTPIDSGAISNGWAMKVTYASVVAGAADLGLALTASSNPTIINSNITYNLMVTNYGPGTANNIVITNLLPAGCSYVSSTPSLGTAGTNALGTNGTVFTWTIPTLAKDAYASLRLVLLAKAVGDVTNLMAVSASTTDLNPADDVVQTVTSVIVPSADLAVGVVSAPDPVMLGQNLTYTIGVTNLGPGTATGIGLTNYLPAGVSLVSASNGGLLTQDFYGDAVLVFTNLGSLGNGASLTVTVVVKPLQITTLFDTAVVGGTIIDPRKINNATTIKSVVMAMPVSIGRTGANLVVSWPADAAGYQLECATNLQAPILWAPVSTPATTTGTTKSVSLPLTNAALFYRLRGQLP